MPQPIVIFDTNTLRNSSLKKYLGGKDLEKMLTLKST